MRIYATYKSRAAYNAENHGYMVSGGPCGDRWRERLWWYKIADMWRSQ